jgi:Domain of unknown function (DUF4287)
MPKPRAHSYRPSMKDESVKAATGKTWAAWFTLLDKAGAADMPHKAIARLLASAHQLPGWWAQMVTVEYERARGRRVKNQKADGFAVNVTRVMACPLPRLYAAASEASLRRKWFPKGAFEQTTAARNKSLRGRWNGAARLHFGFLPKGEGKAQIALEVGKLADARAVETERAAWRKALARLSDIL